MYDYDLTDEEIDEYYDRRWPKTSLRRKVVILLYRFLEQKCMHWLALEMDRDLRWHESLRFKAWSKLEFRMRRFR